MPTVLQITANKFGKPADSQESFALEYFAHAQCLFIINVGISAEKLSFAFTECFSYFL